MSTLEDAIRFCHAFEGELLIELMLRYWRHPLAEDADFRSGLIENVLQATRLSMEGKRPLDDVPPSQMNFVAAVWYAEWAALQSGSADVPDHERHQREAWLEVVRHSLPSCFCDQDDLPA
jgi:hypothetical protein